MKQALLSSREWREHRRALQKAERGQVETKALRRERDREKRRLERLRRALPHLSQHKILAENLANLGEVIVLPADFREQRKNLEQERNEAANRLHASLSRLEELQKKKEGVSLQQDLLNRADEIEEVYQRLGEYRKAMADRPKLEGMRISQKTDAAALLKQIRPDLMLDHAETLRPGLSKRKTIHNLSTRYEALAQSIERSDREIRKHETASEKTREDFSQLPSARDPQDLVQAVKLAQKAGDLDVELNERRRALKIANESCKDELSRLGLWSGPIEEVGKLAIPMQETLNRFEEELDSIHENNQQIQKEKEKLGNEFHQLSTQLQEIRYAGEVPAEKDLIRIRFRRDSGWQLLRRQWIDGEDVAEEANVLSPEAPLPDTYEKLVGLSDQTADRLRREADRVQKHASLKSQIENIENRRSELDIETKGLHSDLADADHRWHELWATCDIIPLSPREMRQWLSGFEKLRFKVAEAEKATGEIVEKEKHQRELRDKLVQELQKLSDTKDIKGHELTPVLLHAEILLESIKGGQIKREKLESKIDDLQEALRIAENERKKAEEKLDQWRSKWAESLTPLELGPGTNPDEANDFIDTLQSCLDKLDEAEDFRKRVDGIDRDNQNFKKDLAHLLEQVADDLQDTEIVQAVSDLQARLNGARQDQAVLKQYLEEIETLEKEILQAQISLNSNKERMAALLEMAGCEKEEEVDEAEQRSHEYVQLQEKLSDLESTLAQIAEGVTFSKLEQQAQDVDPDALPGQIQALSHEIEERLDPEIQQLTETIGREKNEMAKMDGSARAAELADNSQQVLAKIRRLTERFIRVKLSIKILLDIIESYRAEHQDPILKIASSYFNKITLGSFTGLRTDIDDQGKAILIGVRPDGAWVKVEGMSNGTRDQLYLALRLATLEWRLKSGKPMPFIVDDILINFDDDRSRSTLKALAELAEKNQIILFTHHRRIVEIAKTMDASQRVFIHEI
jgi:chromosome segregation ATPase